MSEILSNIVVEQTSINFSPDNNNLNITPEAIQLNIFTGAAPGAGQSSNGELLYNNVNLIDGVPNTSFASGNLTLGNVANIKITGGVNGYVLQTDGVGNLGWTVMTGGGGNGSPGGSNTQIQYNDSGLFGGSSGFTFDKISNAVSLPGNLTVVGNINGTIANANYANFAGNVVNSSQPNITSIGTLTSLSVNGTTSIFEALENVAIIGAQTGTYNFDMLDGSIQYSTGNATANVTINFRGNSSVSANTLISNAKSITSTYIMTTSAAPYTIANITIDSNSQSIKWVNGLVPVAISNVSTAYTFTIVKTNTSPSYTVFASATRYA